MSVKRSQGGGKQNKHTEEQKGEKKGNETKNADADAGAGEPQAEAKTAMRRSDRETRDAGGVECVDRFQSRRSRQGMAKEKKTAVQNGASVQDCVVRRARQACVLVFGIGRSTSTLAQPALQMLRTVYCVSSIAWPWVWPSGKNSGLVVWVT